MAVLATVSHKLAHMQYSAWYLVRAFVLSQQRGWIMVAVGTISLNFLTCALIWTQMLHLHRYICRFSPRKGIYVNGYTLKYSYQRNNTAPCLEKYRAPITVTLHTQEVKERHVKPGSQMWRGTYRNSDDVTRSVGFAMLLYLFSFLTIGFEYTLSFNHWWQRERERKRKERDTHTAVRCFGASLWVSEWSLQGGQCCPGQHRHCSGCFLNLQQKQEVTTQVWHLMCNIAHKLLQRLTSAQRGWEGETDLLTASKDVL